MPESYVTFPSGDITLEAALHTPTGPGPFPGVVVCHPHPTYGGDMDNNVVMAICSGLTRQGIAALRFNFRGAGQSEGAHDGGRGEQEDVLAALQALRESAAIDGSRIGLAGYSFGASMALAVAPRVAELRALAVVAPPTPGLNTPGIQAYARPKLILAGDMDSSIPIEQVHELARGMARPAEVQVLQGGDHFLLGHEGEIAQRIGRFFAGHLGP